MTYGSGTYFTSALPPAYAPRRPASTIRKKMTVVRMPLPRMRSTRMGLFQGDAGADHEQPGARAAGTRANGGTRLNFIDPDVEAERQMRLREPACAAAVIGGRERLAVGARFRRA